MRNIGAQGFRWFLGVIEDRDDPQKLGRVRVRIYNVHSDKKSYLPTDRLPWASIMGPISSSSLNGIGQSPTGIQIGSTVVGFFLDSTEGNYPVVIGTLYGADEQGNHLPPEATEQNKIVKNPVGPEPVTAYRSKYPYNKTVRTERGHVIEIDDTPDFERLHIYHSSGTYYEINQDGRLVCKAVDDNYEIDLKNKSVYVEGNIEVAVKGSYTLNVDGPIVINGKTVNINHGTMGAARIADQTVDNDSEINGSDTGAITTGSGTVFIGD